MSARDSGSSDEEEPFAVTPQDAEMLHVYNTAMSKLAIKSSSSADNFSPLASRLKTSWENTTELDCQKCQEKALQGCLLEKIVDELKSLGADSKWCAQSKTALKACKQYLKTEYPINCRDGQPSTCPDHCRNFALSDNSDDAFKVECDHVHDTVCNSCKSLKTVLRETEGQIRSEHITFYSKDHQEDILYDFVRETEYMHTRT